MSVTNLPGGKDLFGTISPYVVISFGAFLKKTKIKSGQHVTLNEVFQFPVEQLQNMKLRFQVFEEDTMTMDDFIGSAVINVVKDGQFGHLGKTVIDIMSENKVQGRLTLEMLLLGTTTNQQLDQPNNNNKIRNSLLWNNASSSKLLSVFVGNQQDLLLLFKIRS